MVCDGKLAGNESCFCADFGVKGKCSTLLLIGFLAGLREGGSVLPMVPSLSFVQLIQRFIYLKNNAEFVSLSN